jgi:hypothetical protein
MIPFGYDFLMKSVISPLGCILMLIGLLFFSVRLPQHIHDGFESNRLNLFRWSTRRLVAGAAIRNHCGSFGFSGPGKHGRDGDRYEAANDRRGFLRGS